MAASMVYSGQCVVLGKEGYCGTGAPAFQCGAERSGHPANGHFNLEAMRTELIY